ncbi:hypothetical protein TUMSATVNIG1_60230 (plasmid) [Vibrio nigripulchritudo]|uniref:hypothetical protein n=1 Tax=Vibrio nigripulchritudo TaxID=28173 RepID=UPI00190A8E16|nr:hypothetical protein [Vibrio nigripulchritudo]BCL74037.1 hypothetical protein VNTUMSATTG_59740 [Vibrio nigripulchritudo]BDU35414.1 hypothetical protein TUMSATVNIG1_60230 [Vibrio nigripulchritudo]
MTHEIHELSASFSREYLGVEIEKAIDSGDYGTAFELKDGTVLKCTRAVTEAVYATKLLGQVNAHVVQIHDVSMLQCPKGQDLYFIHQEKVQTTHSLIDMAGVAIQEYKDNALSIDKYYSDDELPYSFIERRNSLGFASVVEQIHEGLWSHTVVGNTATDVRTDNLGVRETEDGPRLVLFDQMNVNLESILQLELMAGEVVELQDYLQPRELLKVRCIFENDLTSKLDADHLSPSSMKP